MYLKVTIKCQCGCKYEVLSTHLHSAIACPNCNTSFPASADLVTALAAVGKISDDDGNNLIFENVWDDVL